MQHLRHTLCDLFCYCEMKCLILLAVITVIFYYLWKLKNFWKHKQIPYKEPSLVFGNLWENVIGKKAFFDCVDDIYRKFPDARYIGFNQICVPVLVIKDPELIKQVAIKDFDHFAERQQFTVNEDHDPLWSRNLVGSKAHKWKQLRPLLTPTFTSSKMKLMFTLIDACAQHFVKYFTENGQASVEVELKNAFSRFTNDVIATTAFGIECDSLRIKNNEFYLMGKDLTDLTGLRGLKFFALAIIPRLMQYLGFKVFSQKSASYFVNAIKATIKEREKHNIVRQDFIKLLLDARNNTDAFKREGVDTGVATSDDSAYRSDSKQVKEELTDEDIYAQCLIFFFAAFDTVSDALSLTIYELAINKDIQERLQNEVDEVWEACNGKLNYDVLTKMKYMDMVVSEGLRKWPPITFVDRACLKPYTILPASANENRINIEVGSIIGIPIRSIHLDEKYYPDPKQFDPERFSDEYKNNIKPGTYIPFGLGPRNCIGSRFALLEIKTLFFYLLRYFEIVPNKKTAIPLVWSKSSFNTVAENGIWVDLKQR